MVQYTFSSEQEFMENEVFPLAIREHRSRSEMINLLLQQAVKERNRKRKNAKSTQVLDNTTNPRQEYTG